MAAASDEADDPLVVREFKQYVADSSVAVPVAAIKALTQCIKRSESSTIMGLELELREAADVLKASVVEPFGLNTSISLAAGTDLFLRYVTRTSFDFTEDFQSCKRVLIERGEKFADLSLRSRHRIAELGKNFIQDGAVILTHARSRVVQELLFNAAKKKHFSVVVTEGRPECSGYQVAREFTERGIPVTLITDAAVGYVMEQVDIVIVGAEGVVENGGVVNKMGTNQIALVARACNKPFYVAAESYKFARLFPLSQRDLPSSQGAFSLAVASESLPPAVHIDNPTSDYTPPDFIKLLFTDLGILTPSAVSDELIKLYQ